MGPNAWLLSLAAAAAIAIAVVLAVPMLDRDDPSPTDELVAGQIYSTDAGDSIDLFYEPDEPGMGCMTNLSSGIFYGGTIRAASDWKTSTKVARTSSSWQRGPMIQRSSQA